MTYDYFLSLAERDGIGKAIERAIQDCRTSAEYKAAEVSDAYFNKRNLTIMQYQKMLNTVSGGQIPDRYSANYKVRTLWYRNGVTQIINYLLGNGCDFDTNIKDKLGRKWDSVIMEAAKFAAVHGRSFTFWNRDHAECFRFVNSGNSAGFVPLYDKTSGALAAGIRFWYEADEESGGKSYLACTLYEPDGLTNYDTDKNSFELVEIEPKHGYITTTSKNGIGQTSTAYSNYGNFPIKELFFSPERLPTLEGHRDTIDAHDMILNGFANTVDETSEIVWVLKSFGGMEGESDLAKAIDHLRRLHMISVGEEGDIKPTTVDIPVEARQALLAQLRKSFFEGFMLADMDSLSAAQKTTQEIQAAFVSQDNLASDLEFAIIDHIQDILEVAGLEGEPSFRRNRIVNVTETVQAVVMIAQYLPPEMVPKLMPIQIISPEQAEEAAKYAADMDINRMMGNAGTGDGDDGGGAE